MGIRSWTLKGIGEELSPRKVGGEAAPRKVLTKVLDTEFMEELDSGEKDFSYIKLNTERSDGKPNITWADLRGRDLTGSDLDFSDMRMARVGKTTRVAGASMRWVDARGVEGMEGMDGVESMHFYRMVVTERQKDLINDRIHKSAGVTYDVSELKMARRDTIRDPNRFMVRAFASEDIPPQRETARKDKVPTRG